MVEVAKERVSGRINDPARMLEAAEAEEAAVVAEVAEEVEGVEGVEGAREILTDDREFPT